MAQYRVVDLRSGNVEPEQVVDARSPEEAAFLALGIKGVQGGQNPTRLFCEVHWSDGGQTHLVTLYRPLWEHAEPSSS